MSDLLDVHKSASDAAHVTVDGSEGPSSGTDLATGASKVNTSILSVAAVTNLISSGDIGVGVGDPNPSAVLSEEEERKQQRIIDRVASSELARYLDLVQSFPGKRYVRAAFRVS